MTQLRYGVFLLPDPRTCAAVTTVTAQLRAQYGLVSAGAFPPHVTLVGSLPLAVPEDRLISALTACLEDQRPLRLQNRGVQRLRAAVVYDVGEIDGTVNEPLVALARRVDACVRPLLDPAPPGLPADLVDLTRWRGHLSLASHELDRRADLRDEVTEHVRGLGVEVPADVEARTVALYRLAADSWTGAWWQRMTFEHVRSFRLG